MGASPSSSCLGAKIPLLAQHRPQPVELWVQFIIPSGEGLEVGPQYPRVFKTSQSPVQEAWLILCCLRKTADAIKEVHPVPLTSFGEYQALE